MKAPSKVVVALLAAVGLMALLGGASFVLQGISARPLPKPIEIRWARAARHLLIPAAARATPNPVAPTAEILASAMVHFADHCASCHGNDGKGQTYHGLRMSPRAPDMTASATQSLSDGELFWIIENGVRLTGMPGFGDSDPTNDRQSWELVDFIRHLPRLTLDEQAAMADLNPKFSRADVERELSDEAFLSGAEPGDRKAHPEDEHHH